MQVTLISYFKLVLNVSSLFILGFLFTHNFNLKIWKTKFQVEHNFQIWAPDIWMNAKQLF